MPDWINYPTSEGRPECRLECSEMKVAPQYQLSCQEAYCFAEREAILLAGLIISRDNRCVLWRNVSTASAFVLVYLRPWVAQNNAGFLITVLECQFDKQWTLENVIPNFTSCLNPRECLTDKLLYLCFHCQIMNIVLIVGLIHILSLLGSTCWVTRGEKSAISSCRRGFWNKSCSG